MTNPAIPETPFDSQTTGANSSAKQQPAVLCVNITGTDETDFFRSYIYKILNKAWMCYAVFNMSKLKLLLLQICFLVVSIIFSFEIYICLSLVWFTLSSGSFGPIVIFLMMIMVWPISLIILALNIVCIFAFAVLKDKVNFHVRKVRVNEVSNKNTHGYEISKITKYGIVALFLAIATLSAVGYFIGN